MEKPALDGRRILVIEDDYLVAMTLTDLLEDAGASVLGPIGKVDEALAYIEDHAGTFDAAVLDVNLRGVKSYPIADSLAAREVRFVFATGYGSEALEKAYLGFPRCEKPFDARSLVAALLAN